MRGALVVGLLVASLVVAMPTSPPERVVNPVDGTVLLLVPSGPFVMGSDGDHDDERPRHDELLPAYYIGRTEVTNGQFRTFTHATGHRARGDWETWATPAREAHLVIGVTRRDAEAYCRWAGLRLPSEAEWEKAARGADARRWPWGNQWDHDRCNNARLADGPRLSRMIPVVGRRGTVPVGLFPEGASPCGALDMAGNVWEWCANDYGPYVGNPALESDPSRGRCVARGGGFLHDGADCVRCTRRQQYVDDGSVYIGFRACRDAVTH